MKDSGHAATLAGAAQMVSYLSHLNMPLTDRSERAIIDNTKKVIKNYLKELLPIKLFHREGISSIINNAEISIVRSKKDDWSKAPSSSNNFTYYSIRLKLFYEYTFNLLGDIFKNDIRRLVVSIPVLIKLDKKEAQDPIALEFVVDVSGSMTCPMDEDPEKFTTNICPQNKKKSKINALKEAMFLLLDDIDLFPKAKEKFYIGMIKYTKHIEEKLHPSWGTEKIRQDTKNKLEAILFTGTNSYPAMRKAYKHLMPEEQFFKKLFRKKIPKISKKYIIFMTDGVNNLAKDDDETLKICAKAKEKSIKIFTVSIHAPKKGQYLLKTCASSPNHYYDIHNIFAFLESFRNIGKSITQSGYQIIVKE
ncbi:VWA domain-containing protein [Liberibacter sp. Z1]|nr:VWA domain-containing protein [Candidatus Liberibacter sp.]